METARQRAAANVRGRVTLPEPARAPVAPAATATLFVLALLQGAGPKERDGQP